MILNPKLNHAPREAPWAHLIPAEQWAVYAKVLRAVEARGIPFSLGGGLAFSHYARRWRNTKDIDLYVRPSDSEGVIEVLNQSGLRDYFDVQAYDRKWIYRSHDGDGTIVDIIWQMANYRAQVTDEWLLRGELLNIQGTEVRLLAPEELLWCKLYVLQRDRCDWGDLLNILAEQAPSLDWDRLITNLGDDWLVLGAVLQLFTWACPGKAGAISMDVWNALDLSPPPASRHVPAVDRRHIAMLDSRDWFGANQPE